MDDPERNRPGLGLLFRRFAATLLAVLRNRLELLAVELQEERGRLFHALLQLAAVVVLAVFALGTAAAAFLVLVWRQFGVVGLLIVSGTCFVACALVYWRLRVRLRTWSFLPSTLEELRKDRESLLSGDAPVGGSKARVSK